ncbi:MAG TPA: NUDIX hydrolase, partial [Edaphobacter sp.]|nr:NUDIX hydrolase [Edaphobacter sp.]
KAVRSGREYPLAPIVGVAGVVLHQGHVLLIRRGRQPLLGAWALPGGALELGETTGDGIVREVFEETGVHIKPVEIVATLDRIVRDEKERVRFHYVLVEWLCIAKDEPQQPVCGDDAVEAKWVPLAEVSEPPYDLGKVTLDGIGKAVRVAETGGR